MAYKVQRLGNYSLPVTFTSLSRFLNFKKKNAWVFSKIITELAKPHTCKHTFIIIQSGLNCKPGGF